MALFGKKEEQYNQVPPQTGGMPQYQQQPMDMQNQGYSSQQIYSQQDQQEPLDEQRIEEITEAIIDEKWNEFLKDINKMIEWKERTESRLVRIEQDIKNLKGSFEALHKGVLGKISEYDQNLVEVGTEIKAMEKVFQKILPTFTENVNKLSRLTDNISPKKKK